MKNKPFSRPRAAESGNVLFLILIAVALFAALSYAVTQSTRSGGGDASGETNKINSAQLTQYPAGVRSSVVRMVIGSTDVDSLSFNVPSDFSNLGGHTSWGVFHPDGGGATYALAPGDLMEDHVSGTWHFNSENQIDLIGTTDTGNAAPTDASADVIAFLPNITLSVCNRINQELGLPYNPPPAETNIDVTTNMVASGGTKPGIGNGGDTIGISTAGVADPLDGQPFGCFSQGGQYVYYHVLIER